MEVAQHRLRDIRKVLMSRNGVIRLGTHTPKRMKKRGYNKGDLVSCIRTGVIKEIQTKYDKWTRKVSFCYVIAGRDQSDNPIIVILGENSRYDFTVVTVMPPLDQNRFDECI